MTRTAVSTPAPSAGTASFGRRSAMANLGAQSAALAVVSVASLLVARIGGAAVLGEYTLLRVLPWLVAVLCSCGLPVAASYFLGRDGDTDRSLRPTLAMIAVVGSLVGVLVWLGLTPILHRVLLSGVSIPLLLLMGTTVITQLWTVAAKACCQGSADLRGAHMIIVCEELMFLPAYGVCLVMGLRGVGAVALAMVTGGAAAAMIGVGRLVARGFFRDRSAPSLSVARTVVAFGARGQLGNLLWLMNLRLDFIILGALAGPAPLGVYAVASKFAELMRLPATALNYVLYPRFTRATKLQAAADARRLLPRACALTTLATPVLAGASVLALPLLFGSAFRSAVVPACVLLIGLSVEGAAAVASAYLWGRGRPGANSIAMGVGVAFTLALDVLLIPAHGALGAAVASSVAYLATACVLTYLTRLWVVRPPLSVFRPANSGASR